MKAGLLLQVHSTRLFPKSRGATRYEITGIASKCDWVVLSDLYQPHTELRKQRNRQRPTTIFLSLRAPVLALKYFISTVLPDLKHPFILISGSEDYTIPRQIDKRRLAQSELINKLVNIILDHPMLQHWTAENLDDDRHPKFRPLPLGLLLKHNAGKEDVEVPETPNLLSRPLRALCAHRVRIGGQWETRKQVTRLAKQNWSDWCTSLDNEVSEAEYMKLMHQHSFILCVEGGGLDPSPKAWQAMLYGAIPVIRKNTLYQCYRHLPVAFVDDWTPEALSIEKLQYVRSQLAHLYDTEAGRKEVLRRLSLNYWWNYAIAPKAGLQEHQD